MPVNSRVKSCSYSTLSGCLGDPSRIPSVLLTNANSKPSNRFLGYCFRLDGCLACRTVDNFTTEGITKT